MSTRSTIPFGPQHPVLPEPIHLDLVLEDEKVVEAVPSIGFVHRGWRSSLRKKNLRNMCTWRSVSAVSAVLCMVWATAKPLSTS